MVAGNAMCVQRKLGKNNAILYHHLDSVIYTLMEHIPGVDINSTKEETELVRKLALETSSTLQAPR